MTPLRFALALLLTACTGTPAVVQQGGGVHGSFVDTTAIVVLDPDGERLANVEVRRGLPPGDTVLGRTNEHGELRVGRENVVTALHDGVAVSVIGADASSITLAFPSLEAPSVEVTADVDLAAIPLDGADDVIAAAGFTRDVRLDAPANAIVQPPDAVTTCALSTNAACSLRMRVRSGTVRVFTAFARVFHGAAGPDDDRIEAAGLALSEPIDTTALASAQIALALLPASELTRLSIGTASVPANLRAVVGVPGARSESTGIVVWPIASDDALVPRAFGAEPAIQWAIGEAIGEGVFSRSVQRAAANYEDGQTITLDRWLAPPSLAVDGATIRIGERQQGALRLEVRDASGAIHWRADVLDATSAFGLPIALPDGATVRATLSVHSEPLDDLAFEGVEARHGFRAWTECRAAQCP